MQLLKYEFGKVTFQYPYDYRLIQSLPLDVQLFKLNLFSSRTIETINLKDNSQAIVQNNGNEASVLYEVFDLPADLDFEIEYSLSNDELGLFGFSTMLPDSLIFDKENGSGYFTFIAEPNPKNNNEIIDKVFTLIIDKNRTGEGSSLFHCKQSESGG